MTSWLKKKFCVSFWWLFLSKTETMSSVRLMRASSLLQQQVLFSFSFCFFVFFFVFIWLGRVFCCCLLCLGGSVAPFGGLVVCWKKTLPLLWHLSPIPFLFQPLFPFSFFFLSLTLFPPPPPFLLLNRLAAALD